MKFSAVVSNNSTLIPTAPVALKKWLEKRKGACVVMELLDETSRRTKQANSYYWGCVVQTFMDIWSKPRVAESLPPYSKDEVHEVLVKVLFGTMKGPLGVDIAVPTHTMDKDTFNTLLIERAKELAWQQYEVRIPDPETWESDL